MCQYKAYESDDFQNTKFQAYNHAEIEDYLVLGDVNSLYPAAQRMNAYAYGKWKYVPGGDEYLHRLMARHESDEGTFTAFSYSSLTLRLAIENLLPRQCRMPQGSYHCLSDGERC